MLAGIGYAAVGTLNGSDERDYHYGVAPQALAGLRVIFGDRASLDLIAREYFVSGIASSDTGGHDNIVRAEAGFTYRIHKQHAISIRYLLSRQDATFPDLGDRTQSRATIGIFYTLPAHDRFGATEWRQTERIPSQRGWIAPAREALPYNRAVVRLDDFDFELPKELIAQRPAKERAASRLLCVDGRNGALADRRFRELPELVGPADVVVFNDTKVINARLFGVKSTGGQVEMLVERLLDQRSALVQIRASKPPRAGSAIHLFGGTTARVLGREGEFYRLQFESNDLAAYLERHGAVPLPPYIEHAPDDQDASRYQTVYSRHAGAVAAPTAGLHFDEAMLAGMRRRGIALGYITLHVGAGTFQPVRVGDVRSHVMHSEWFNVPAETVAAIEQARARKGRVLAVGTTTLRAVESAAASGKLRAGLGETNLFILPGYRFRVVERLLTNFHLPKSTLLMLVSAFGGMEHIRRAYRHAVEARYRFFSYGDAMLIEQQDGLAPA